MTLKRNPSSIQNKVYIKDNKLYAKEKTIIEFPKWYLDKELGSIQEVAYVYGIFAMIIGNEYSVSVIPTLLQTSPIMVTEIEREDGVVYMQFVYGKDDCVLDDMKAVKFDVISYNFFETYFMYARVPWYVEYEDLARIMDNLPGYAKSGVGGNPIANELVSSFITRSVKDKHVFHRQDIKSSYTYVDLMSRFYSVAATVNKLGGNYMTESIVSALVQPSTKTTKLEILAR